MIGDIVEIGTQQYRLINDKLEEFDCIEDAEEDIGKKPYPLYIVIDHQLFTIYNKEV